MKHLACISSAAFFRHTGAMLHSALQHTTGPVTVHLLHDEPLTETDHEKLMAVTAKFGATFAPKVIDPQTAKNFRDGYFPRAIWFRILLPDLLPDVDRILYLDSDLVVGDDLNPLWETDLGSHLLAAVVNPFYPFMPNYPVEVLGFERSEDYFNSGVLLMNLAQMREEHCVDALAQYAVDHPHCAYPDQDALNVVCRGRWLALEPRWNAQSTFFELPARHLPCTPSSLAKTRERPAVVHFIGPFKPWTYICRHPLRQLYFDQAEQTPWGKPVVSGFSIKNMILRRLPLAWIDRWYAVERKYRRWNQTFSTRWLRRLGLR